MEPTKRELRQQKRDIKRAGSKRRRRQLKQQLVEHPDEAPAAEFDFGRYQSASLNGMDHDGTRRSSKARAEPHDFGATEPHDE